MEERDRHRPVELGKKPVELERMKSRERDVECWPEAVICGLSNQRPGLLTQPGMSNFYTNNYAHALTLISGPAAREIPTLTFEVVFL